MNAARALVIGNWKMNLDFVEGLHLTQQIAVIAKNRPLEHTDVVLAPPFVDLRTVSSVIESERLRVGLGAQHVNPHENGAHTGEVSMSMLSRLGVAWVIVGHSERREHYFMSDEIVAATLQAVVRGGAIAVLCVGESLAQRDAGEAHDVVRAQLDAALATLEERHRDQVVVAYEPLWAIGTGVTAEPAEVAAMTQFVRSCLRTRSLEGARVLYGGSVNPANAAALLSEGEVDGFLVGGASLKAESFCAILQACDDCYALKR